MSPLTNTENNMKFHNIYTYALAGILVLIIALASVSHFRISEIETQQARYESLILDKVEDRDGVLRDEITTDVYHKIQKELGDELVALRYEVQQTNQNILRLLELQSLRATSVTHNTRNDSDDISIKYDQTVNTTVREAQPGEKPGIRVSVKP